MAASSSSKTAVYAALVGNVLVAITKFGAATWTGSSAMMSEAVHSLVDTGNEILLLYGIRSSARRADWMHPLGYGRELYFWSFVVAILIFALGAAVSIQNGIAHVRQPRAVTDAAVNYAVLALAFVFEGSSWVVSVRQFAAAKGELGWYEAFRRSKDPPSFMILFEDSAALIGILVAAFGTFAASALDVPVGDGVASIVIGLLLAVTSMLLARESKSLLIGERADRPLADAILRIAAGEPGVESANGLLTTHLAPDQVVAALSVHFAPQLSAGDVEAAVARIESKICAAHPNVVALFVKPQTDRAFRESVLRRYGEDAPIFGRRPHAAPDRAARRG